MFRGLVMLELGPRRGWADLLVLSWLLRLLGEEGDELRVWLKVLVLVLVVSRRRREGL